jgi:NAD(P)-dependent dehydrogenase (short-subunit alcohol dehydrogenase family)
MTGELDGKSAVVTGAGRGIGKEIALALAAEGAKIVVDDPGVDRDGSGKSTTPADEVVEMIKSKGGEAIASYETVDDHAGAEKLIRTCIDKFGRIDILCNVAGILREQMVWKMTEDNWDSVISVHLKGTFNCCKFACAYMKEQNSGRIINTTSDAWRRGSFGQTNYSAAKAGIVGFTRALSLEMAKFGVTCNAISPGAATRMTVDDKVVESFKKRYEAGEITKERLDAILDAPGPELVPPIVVYLAAEAAANITGRVFGCTGGNITLFSEPMPIRSIYRDHKKQGPWNIEELTDLMPKLVAGLPSLSELTV